MKKLLALALGMAFFSNLYGFTIGAGIAGYDVAREGRSFSLLADAAHPDPALARRHLQPQFSP
jgi:hypothetical protein